MEIERFITIHSVMSLAYGNSIRSADHKIEYIEEMKAILVDSKVLIPMHNVAEILLKPKKETVVLSQKSNESVIEKPKKHRAS